MEQGYFCRHQSLAAGSRGAPRENGRETGRFLAARQNTMPLGSLPFPPRSAVFNHIPLGIKDPGIFVFTIKLSIPRRWRFFPSAFVVSILPIL